MKISVIIPVYNDLERLQTCVRSILGNNASDIEIIIVDNASDEPVHLPMMVDNIRIFHETRRGSYAARNTGIINASGDILGFTDSDCIVDQYWIENAVTALQSKPDAGFIGGRIRMFSDSENHRNFIEKYELYFPLNQEALVKFANFAATANMWTYKHVMENVGLFRSDLLSSGDKEWGHRVVSAGYKGHYNEDVIVNHPVRANRIDFRNRQLRIGAGFYDISEDAADLMRNLYLLIIIGKRRLGILFFRTKLPVKDKIGLIFVIILERVYALNGFLARLITRKQYR